MPRRSRMYFRFPVIREVVPQETGNDFRFADWRMDLLEEWSAESENALGLRCPAAVVIAQFIGGGM